MFNPEMMAAAQKMMANMKPDDMKKMSDMAAGMDPKVMENMMKNQGMGGGLPAGYDMKQAAEQMKNMTPEQMQQGLGQMNAQKNYVYQGAVGIKNEGNTLIKDGKHKEALEQYNRALENLKPHGVQEDVRLLQQQLMTNSALCYSKLKEHQKAIDVCEDALIINPKSVKAIYRRGSARFELGQKAEALTDVKQAATMSPEDKTIASELKRLEFECRESGMKDEDIQAAWRKAKEAIEKAPAASSSSTSSGVPQSLAPGGTAGGDDMSEAMQQMQKNPEMMKQAQDMMKNMNPEDMDRMMKMREGMQGGKMPENMDMSAMSKVFEDPNMMKTVAEMAKNMGGSGDSEESAMMQQAAEQLQSNPEMGKAMSDMMKNMPPEQMQKMMEMSTKMRSKKSAGGSSSSTDLGGPAAMDPGDMMSDPDMMAAAEEMMKSMSPETLAAMAKSQGIDIDENKAKMISRFLPWAMKGMRCFQSAKKGVKTIFSPTGRWVIAAVVLGAALYQHYYADGASDPAALLKEKK